LTKFAGIAVEASHMDGTRMNWKNVKEWNHQPATAKSKQEISWKSATPITSSIPVTESLSNNTTGGNVKQKLASLLFQ
jgi:hypothetical protein